MLSRWKIKNFEFIFIILAVASFTFTACTLTPRPAPIPISMTTPTAAPEDASVINVSVDPVSPEELLAQGEEIFQKTAGGVGCQYCHGPDGKGKIGPNIRGKPEEAIQNALGLVLQMQIVKLNDQEIRAVAAYLKYLETQP